MDDDVRNRFRSASQRRDYVGSSPSRPEEVTGSTPKQPSEPPRLGYAPRATPLPPEKPKKKRQRRTIKWLLVTVVIVGLVVGGYFVAKKYFFNKDPTNNIQQQPRSANNTQAKIETKKSIKLVATGDMIAHSAILERAKKPNGTYDFTPMLANMKTYFDKADVRFCNQATPAGGESFGYSGYPVFNAPLEWPRAIEGVGCDVVNIGTNHTNDKGQGLIDATVAAWDNRPNVLAVVGANRSAEEQAKVRYFKKDDVRFAILSYTTYSNSKPTTTYGINMYDKSTANKQVTEAKKNADIVIISMRWGTEYSPGVNAQQDAIAQELSNAGADVVLGHGSHFLEPVKKLKGANGNDTLMWFSLGNFLNAQIETESLIGGFAIMDIDVATKKVSEPKFMPTYMHYEWSAADKAANNLLTRKNFQMYPLDQAADPMSKSQINTTVEAQTDRVNKLLNTYTPVVIVKSDQF